MTRRIAPLLVAATLAVTAPSYATTLTGQQITLSNDAISEDWAVRTSSTSRGKILFVGGDIVRLFNGTTIQTVQNAVTNEAVNSTVFMLGSGASGSSVVGGWRRANGYADLSVDGVMPPTKVDHNPESVSIGDGCVFMVMQDGFGAHVYKLDPTTGSEQKLSSGTVTLGALRVHSSGCTKAAWSWMPTNASPMDIQYWNGTTTTTVATDVATKPSFAGGRIVYAKIVSGIQQVFTINTNGALSPVQLSAETDATKVLDPQTDGRHVAWYRSNLDGTNASVVLNGGLTFPTGPLAKVSAETPLQLNRGQIF